jgi:shikimate kinase
MNIVLTGFMATGKSAVGKILSQRLRRPFFDTDDMIEKQTGLAITQIFSGAGEDAFRDMETQTVGLVALMPDAVIATGGGAPLRPANMAELEKNGRVFCLTAEPETILERLRSEPATRPLLQGEEPLRRIKELLNERAAAYGRCAHRVPTDGKTPAQVAEEILKLFPLS